MDCTRCQNKSCRKGEKCALVDFNIKDIVDTYIIEQRMVQAAAKLVDNGRAGMFSRLDVKIEF